MKFYGSAMIIAVMIGGQHFTALVNAINLRLGPQVVEPSDQSVLVMKPDVGTEGIVPEMSDTNPHEDLDP